MRIENSTSFEERLGALKLKSQDIQDWLALLKHDFGATDDALKLLTKKEAAALLGVSEPTFRKMLQSDPQLPRYQVTNTSGGLRFNKAALLNYFIEASSDWMSHIDLATGIGM